MNKLLSATALAIVLGATAAVALADTVAEKTSPPAASSTTTTKDGLVLTEAQAQTWIKKTVYSSDGTSVGAVTALKRDANGKVSELQASVGGFLGIGETHVRVMPDQFRLANDRVVLSLTAEQVKTLPAIAK
jgi:hypothetical protein